MNDRQIDELARRYLLWQKDWNLFAYDVFGVRLDKEQRAILSSIQNNPKTTIMSGTARGKDYVMAVACMCFMYLTPKIKDGILIENTKIALTAPTARQIENIMYPEITRLFNSRRIPLIGRLVSNDIRTPFDEWFLTGFKADDQNTEAWTGFHASNVMFCVTEASGMADEVFNNIEGNLQGNSRLAIAFNPNVSVGYAARSQKTNGWDKFRLNSLESINVKRKKIVITGQVDYVWLKDKVDIWCETIRTEEFDEGKDDFEFEGMFYRPNDLFRVKVLGKFPEVSEDVLIPYRWVELANERWKKRQGIFEKINRKLGVDVAGMGRDSSVICDRYGNYVKDFEKYQSGGKADHMKVAGLVKNKMDNNKTPSFIDTIGEGAGVYSRLLELGYDNAYSCKYSEGAKRLHDITGQYEFANMRAYLFWSVRDWLNPANKFDPCIPPNDDFMTEATEIRYIFQSSGKIIIEPKEKIIKRLKRSTDIFDSLANTFYPEEVKEDGVEMPLQKGMLG